MHIHRRGETPSGNVRGKTPDKESSTTRLGVTHSAARQHGPACGTRRQAHRCTQPPRGCARAAGRHPKQFSVKEHRLACGTRRQAHRCTQPPRGCVRSAGRHPKQNSVKEHLAGKRRPRPAAGWGGAETNSAGALTNTSPNWAEALAACLPAPGPQSGGGPTDTLLHREFVGCPRARTAIASPRRPRPPGAHTLVGSFPPTRIPRLVQLLGRLPWGSPPLGSSLVQ